MSALGERVLDWLLRRHARQKSIETDLVLVRQCSALEDAPATFSHGGTIWHFARVNGELTLRDVLLRGGRLVAAVPESLRLPLDLVERAYLRRLISVEAHDIVAALAGTFCARIQSAALADAILERPHVLAEHAGAWTLGGQVVTETEVKQVLLAADMGFDRKLERIAPAVVLARWIELGTPTPALPELLEEALRTTHGRTGGWLAWALREGSVDPLVSAGALAGTPRGRSAGPKIPGLDSDDDWEALRQLVEDAVRAAWTASPSAVALRLRAAEDSVHRLALRPNDASKHPLLRATLDRALFELAHGAADGEAPAEADLAAIERRHLYAKGQAEPIALLRDIARLARFEARLPAIQPGDGATVGEWAAFARDHVGFVDLALRSARRRVDRALADLAGPARRVIERTVRVRDELNRAFAETLARNETAAYANATLPGPLPLYTLTRALVRPLVDAGRRVLLIVLDGCDLSTFYELALERPDDLPVGLSLPDLGGSLASILEPAGALLVGLSPLPTVTSHARRAIFAGEIPGNPVLDDTEAAAANATADARAWAQNAAVRGIRGDLFLKGDLGEDGKRLIEALHSPDAMVIAAVFNGVDDALSSHQTTALGPWRYSDLGAGFPSVLRTAIDKDWTVVITSDHGHTPYLDSGRNVGASGPQRYGMRKMRGSLELATGTLRDEPLHVLTDVGAYAGPQCRGFHGGAGLEEVVVPIALLGPVPIHEGRPTSPPWYSGEDRSTVSIPRAAAVPAESEAVRAAVSGIALEVLEVFHDQPSHRRVLQILADKQVIGSKQLAPIIGRPEFLLRGLVGEIQRMLQRRRVAIPFVVEEHGDEQVYRWRVRS